MDLTNELVEQLITQTKEMLQPNPATRAKLTVNARLRGPGTTAGATSHAYPQPEGVLGDTMVKFGTDLGADSTFGRSLIETGKQSRSDWLVHFPSDEQLPPGPGAPWGMLGYGRSGELRPIQ